MNTFRQTVASLALAAASATAAANTNDDVVGVFSFKRGAPAEVTYDRFERVAKRACTVDARRAGGFAPKWQAERLCVADLLSKAIVATRDAELLALHQRKTGIQAEQLLTARR